MRQDFIRFARVEAGDCVLECGAGGGDTVFDGKLIDAVGPAGSVVATDPAVAPLVRLQSRAAQRGVRNVTVMEAKVERLPFPKNRFDTVLGMFFLQFTDTQRALTEMLRVARPEGTVAAAVFVSTPYERIPWYREWFSPVLDLAQRFGVPVSAKLHGRGEVAALLDSLGAHDVETEERESVWMMRNPEATIAHLLVAVDFFAAVMHRLPWKAREDLVAELRRRGDAVMDRYTDEERVVRQPVEFVRARP